MEKKCNATLANGKINKGIIIIIIIIIIISNKKKNNTVKTCLDDGEHQ
jgi:hypothetical protein